MSTKTVLDYELNVDISKLSADLDTAGNKFEKFTEKVDATKEAVKDGLGLTKDQQAVVDTGLIEDKSALSLFKEVGSGLTEMKSAYAEILKSGTNVGQAFLKPFVEMRSLVSDVHDIVSDMQKTTSGVVENSLVNRMNMVQSRMKALTSDMKTYQESVASLSPEAQKIWSNDKVRSALQDRAAIYVRSQSDAEKTSLSSLTAGALRHSSFGEQLKQLGAMNASDQEALARLSIISGSFRTDRLNSGRYLSSEIRADASRRNYNYIHERVPGAFAQSFLLGGNTPDGYELIKSSSTSNARRKQRIETYTALRQAVENGNNKALGFAIDAGLVKTDGGRNISYNANHKIQWLDEKRVSDAQLDYVGALAAQEAKRALEGMPMYHKSIRNYEDISALLGKENKGFDQAYEVMALDTRDAINPYLSRKNAALASARAAANNGWYGSVTSTVPKLKVQDMIQIPQFALSKDGRYFVNVNDETRQNAAGALNYEFTKHGIQESDFDEWITMRRSPIMDALVSLDPQKRKFVNRSYGYGFDKNDNAIKGTPFVAQLLIDDLFQTDEDGNVKFDKDNKTPLFNQELIQTDHGKISKQDLVQQLATRQIPIKLKTDNGDEDYQVLSMNVTGGRTRFLVALANDIKKLDEQDDKAGLLRRSQFFNEMMYDADGGLRLIGKDGKPLGTDAGAAESYAKYYDYVRKMFSDSVPIEELGGKTPKVASIDFGAYYDAKGITKDSGKRFDGGIFHMPWVADRDFQGRMGMAKFYSTMADWQNFFIKGGGAYQTQDGDKHMYLPGLGTATAEDYKAYLHYLNQITTRKADSPIADFTATSNTLLTPYLDKKGNPVEAYSGIKTLNDFYNWRNAKFIDILQPDIGILASGDTVNKSYMKGGKISLDLFQRYSDAQGNGTWETLKVNEILNPDIAKRIKSKEWQSLSEDERRAEAASMIVTLTPEQQTAYLNANASPDRFFGLRAMKEAENYSDVKDFLNPALASAIVVTPEMVNLSLKNYRNELSALQDPREIKKRLFSGNDILSQTVQNDESAIFFDKAVRARIEERRNQLQENIAKGLLYLPGFQDVKGVAPSLYDALSGFIKDVSGQDTLFGVAENLKLDKNEIYARTNSRDRETLATRSPYAVGSSIAAQNIYRAVTEKEKARKESYESAMKEFQLSGDSAIFNIADFYKLNTGDFDGDFAFLLASDSNKYGDYVSKTMQQNAAVVGRMEQLKKEAEAAKVISEQQKVYDTSLPAAAARQIIGGRVMGSSYLAGQVGRTIAPGIDGFTSGDIADIQAQANLMYMYGTDQAKHLDAQSIQTNKKYNKAMAKGKTADRLTKALLEAHANNGEGYKDIDILSYRMPTYFDLVGISMLEGARQARLYDPNSMSGLSKSFDEYLKGYENEPEAVKAAYAWYTDIFKARTTGKWQKISGTKLDEGKDIISNLDILEADIEKQLLDQNLSPEARTKLEDKKALYHGILGRFKRRVEDEEAYGITNDAMDQPFLRRFGTNFISDQDLMNEQSEITSQLAEQLYQQRLYAGQARNDEVRESKEDQAYQNYINKRKLIARQMTSYNWSTASEFMPEDTRITHDDVRILNLRDQTAKSGVKEVFEPNAIDDRGLQAHYLEGTIRQILTGQNTSDPDAITGSLAHEFLNDYVRGRALQANKSTSRDLEAEDRAGREFAQQQLLSKLKIMAGVGSEKDENLIQSMKDAGIKIGLTPRGQQQFEEDLTLKDFVLSGNPNFGQATKVWQDSLSRAKKRFDLIKEGRPEEIVDRFLAPLFNYTDENYNPYNLVAMAEGTLYDTDGRILKLNNPNSKTEFPRGIRYQPNEHEVGGMYRLYQDDSGEFSEKPINFAFTPDAIIRNKNNPGTFSIIDYKSSEGSAKKGRIQAEFYAHLLENLGKEAWKGDRQDLDAFKMFWNNDTGKSNITQTGILDMFNPEGPLLREHRYDESMGQAAFDVIERSWGRLSTAVREGFVHELKPDKIKESDLRIGKNRTLNVNRPLWTILSELGEQESGFNFEYAEKAVDYLAEHDELFNQVVSNPSSKYYQAPSDVMQNITLSGGQPANKEYLTMKLARAQDVLDNAGSLAFRTRGYRQPRRDDYSRTIADLENLYSKGDIDAIEAYARQEDTPPDVKLMIQDSLDSINKKDRLISQIRAQGIRNISTDMTQLQTDIEKTQNSKGNLSSLMGQTMSRIDALYAQNELRKEDQYFNGDEWITTEELAYGSDLLQKMKDNQKAEEYNKSIEEKNKAIIKKNAPIQRKIAKLEEKKVKNGHLSKSEETRLANLQESLTPLLQPKDISEFTDEEKIKIEEGVLTNGFQKTREDAAARENDYNATLAQLTDLRYKAFENIGKAASAQVQGALVSTDQTLFGKNIFLTSLEENNIAKANRVGELIDQRSKVVDLQGTIQNMLNATKIENGIEVPEIPVDSMLYATLSNYKNLLESKIQEIDDAVSNVDVEVGKDIVKRKRDKEFNQAIEDSQLEDQISGVSTQYATRTKSIKNIQDQRNQINKDIEKLEEKNRSATPAEQIENERELMRLRGQETRLGVLQRSQELRNSIATQNELSNMTLSGEANLLSPEQQVASLIEERRGLMEQRVSSAYYRAEQAYRFGEIDEDEYRNRQNQAERIGIGFAYEETPSSREDLIRDIAIQRQVEAERTRIENDRARVRSAYTANQIEEEEYKRRIASLDKQQTEIDNGNYQQRIANAYDGGIEMRNAQQQNAIKNAEFQADMIARQQQQQFDRYNRTRYGQSTSRFINAYWAQVDYKNNLQNTIDTRRKDIATTSNVLNAMRTQYRGMQEGDAKNALGAQIEATEKQLNGYKDALSGAEQQMQSFSKGSMVMSAGLSTVNSGIQMLVTRLGRQLFQKALQEAKQFVKQFNATMTEIQMITLKTDSQMSTLGDGLIAKAKELKVSITDISTSAATLYRQGLSDEEVDERLDVISKFSKVSGTKVEDATKLVTVAINTGLVSDASEAADIVTALGDSAATNAAQIEKGIERAGAAAAADGTTFGQLAAMLTAITSTTQLGGNVAGRTLNTIFGRMNKVGTNELIYDENGNAVSGSEVSKLLAAQGVRTYDENGNKRSTFDVLYDLSQKWDSISDAAQQQISNAIAGTRMYSNFAAIMSGMADGDIDEYMSLIGESTGITDQKYEIYAESLEAALTNLKNTFDELVDDLNSSGIAQDVIGWATNIIQGIDNIVNSAGGLEKVVALMITLSAAMIALKSGNPIAMAAGAAVAGVSLVGLNALGSQEPEQNSYQKWTAANQRIDDKNKTREDRYSELQDLKSKGSSRTEEENKRYKGLIESIFNENAINNIDNASDATEGLATAADALTQALKGTTEETDAYAQKLLDEEEARKQQESVKTVYSKVSGFGSAFGDLYEQNTEDAFSNISNLPDSLTWVPTSSGTDIRQQVNQWVSTGKDNAAANVEALAETMAEASAANAFTNDKFNHWNKSEWLNNISSPWSPARNAALSDENIEDYQKWWNVYKVPFVNSNDQIYHQQFIETLEHMYAELLEDTASTEMIQAIARDTADQFDYQTWGGSYRGSDTFDADEETILQKIVEDTIGFTTNNENFDYKTFEEALLRSARNGKYKTGTETEEEYGLEPVGKYGYYLDEEGNSVSLEEATRRIDEVRARNKQAETQAEIEAQAQAAYDYDQKILDEYYKDLVTSTQTNTVNLENEARSLYYESLKENTEAVNEARTAYENDKKRSVVTTWDQLSEPERRLYYPSFDSLSEEEKDKWLDMAEDSITWKEAILDTNALSTGAERTKEEIIQFIQDGGKILEEAADGVGTVTFDVEDIPKFTPVKNEFVESLNNYTGGWLKSNQSKVDADRLISLISANSFGEGVEGLTAFMEYMNANSLAQGDWVNVYSSSAELQRIMAQATWNAETQSWTAPEDIMSQIINVLYGSSLTYGSKQLTTQQKATSALTAFNGLTNESWFISNEEREKARDEAWAKYQNEVLTPYDNEIKAINDGILSETEKQEQIAEANTHYDADNLLKTREEFIASRNDLNFEFMSPEQQTYLKEALGDELYQSIVDHTATTEETEYVSDLLKNRTVGLTSFTAKQQLRQIQDVVDNIDRLGVEGGYSTFVANQVMSGWSDWNEYAGLMQAKNKNDEDLFARLGGEERLSELNESLANFQKNAQIKVSVTGVQELEDAGKVLEGTTKLIENLQKNSSISIKAKIEFDSNLYSNEQQYAKLVNGTYAEQVEAIKEYTGRQITQIQGENFTEAYQEAMQLAGIIHNQTGESLVQMYQTSPETALDYAEKYGYKINENYMSDQEITDYLNQLLESKGNDSEFRYDSENGVAYIVTHPGTEDEREFVASDYFQQYYKDRRVKFVYNGNPAIDRENLSALAERNYSAEELAAARQRIINGTLTANSKGEYDLYKAAYSGLGTYGAEYMRQLYQYQIGNGPEPSDQLKQLAEYESSEAVRNAAQTYRTEAINYEQARLAVAGPRNDSNIDTLKTYLNKDEQQIMDMSDDELNAAIKEKQTNIINGLVENLKNIDIDPGTEGLQSLDLSNVTDFDSLVSELESAAESLDDEVGDLIRIYIDALKNAGSAATQTFAEAYKSAETKLNENTYEQQGLQFIQKYAVGAIAQGRDHGLSPIESLSLLGGWNQDWNSAVFGNQNTVAALSLLNSGRMNESQFNSYIGAQISGGAKDQDYYASLGQVLFGKQVNTEGNFDLPQTTSDIEALQTAIQAIQDNADLGTLFSEWSSNIEGFADAISSLAKGDIKGAQDVLRNLNDQMNSKRASDITKYGKAAANTGTAISKIKKGGKDASEGVAMLRKDMQDFQDQTTAIQNAKGKSGKQLTSQTREILAEMFDNISADDIKNMTADQLDDLVSGAQEAIDESFTDTLQAAIDSINPIIDLSGVSLETDGSISLDALIAACDDASAEVFARIAAMAGTYGQVHFKIVEADDTVKVVAEVSTQGKSNGKYNRSSSGGGGGKSASEKLVDEWKHKVTAQEHEVSMAGIQAQDAAQQNNGAGYINAIDKQISENEKLRKVYEEELVALKEQLTTVTEFSDDWWTVKEAIQSAEEAQAQLNKTIADLETSKMNEIIDAYEYLSGLASHETTQAELNTRIAKQDADYTAWRESLDERVSARQQETVAAQEAKEQLEQLREAYVQNGGSTTDDTYQDYTTEINKLEETISSEAADIRDIMNEQLDIAKQQLSNELLTPEYYDSILSSRISQYNSENNSTMQLAAIEARKANANDRIAVYEASNDELSTQLIQEYNDNGYSQQYYDILSQMYSNLEAIEQCEQDIRDLTEQRLSVITEYFDNILSDNTHDRTMLSTQQTLLDYYNDYSGRQSNLSAQQVAISERRTTLQQRLNTLTAEQANYVEGDENWIKTRDEINQTKEDLYSLLKDETELDKELYNAAKENYDNLLKPFTHASNMYAIDSERFSRRNDFENLDKVLDYEIQNNNDMAAIYQETYDEMMRLRDTVDEGSDAWWNFNDAAMAAAESLAKVENENAKLNAQRLTNLVEKQTNEDKTSNHTYDMLTLVANRALLQEDYDAYEKALTDQQYSLRDSIELNKSQVAELEELLATYEIDSDEWIKTRDEIWKIKADTAKKENEAIKLEQQIAQQRLAQITQELTRNNAYATHRNTMMQNYGTIYQRYGNYTGYRDTLAKQVEDWEAIAAATEAAREETLAQMAELEIGSSEWYKARDAVYSYDEALLRAKVETENLEKATNMSFLQQVQDTFNDTSSILSLQLAAVRADRQNASSNNNTEDYKKYAEQEKSLLQDQINNRLSYIEQQKLLMASFTKETEEWKQAKQNILNALQQNIADQLSIDSLDADIAKSWIDKIFERMDWADSETTHNLNLIQYEQTRYQNKGELTNYGIMLQKENEERQKAIQRREEEIEQLKAEREQLEDNATEYKRVTEKIKAKEEAIAADTTAIEENTKKLKENEIAIANTRKTLEDMVEKEIKADIELKKKQLKAEVDLQKTIIDTIKQRYKDQWEIEKKDIQKQKEALQEYKNTLNERLNARKNAMEVEEKYRQLEEYQQQLTLISADPTRTKDAKTLREQIRTLEKEIAWDRASEAVEAETDAIDDAIQSLDDYVTVHEEDLEALLADSRNFADDVNLILQGSFESIVEWLAQNNTEFKNATDEARQQMTESWEQTWKDMYGIVDTYWTEIDEILSSYENFIDYMTQTPDYLNASATQQWLILQDLAQKYEDFANSAIASLEAIDYATHQHDLVEETESSGSVVDGLDLSWLDLGQEADAWKLAETAPDVEDYWSVGVTDKEHIVTPSNIETDDMYDNVGITPVSEDYSPDYTTAYTPVTSVAPAEVWTFPEADDSGFGGFVFPTADDIQSVLDSIVDPAIPAGTPQATKTYTVTWKNADGTVLEVDEGVEAGSTPQYNGATPTKASDGTNNYTFSGWTPTPQAVNSNVTFTAGYSSEAIPQTTVETEPTTTTTQGKTNSTTRKYTVQIPGMSSVEQTASSVQGAITKAMGSTWTGTVYVDNKSYYVEKGKIVKKYASGGLVDYTGPAWVDGTKTHPESFLDAYDTELLRNMLDAFSYVKQLPVISTAPSDAFGFNQSIGDIYVTIEQAELKDGEDLDRLAREVGNRFNKELSKQGFSTARYSM